MDVYQIRLKLYFLQDISADKIQESITFFIDKSFLNDNDLAILHEENRFKNYCYDFPYPWEKNKIYQQDKIYTLTIRTIDKKLADFFKDVCVNTYTREFKGLTADLQIVPQKIIEFIYTLTPLVIKDSRGYWRKFMSTEEYAYRLKSNLINKWQDFTNEQIDDDFELFSTLEFLNRIPISMNYKQIKLLGDKVRLSISDNPTAQKLAYMAIGTGIGEMNSRGAGFVNHQWL